MTNRSFLAFWLLFGLGAACLAPPASAWSQHMPKRKAVPKEPTEESVTLNGVIQRVTSTQIEVLVDSPAKEDQKNKNKNAPHGTWTVSTLRGTKFHVEGEATPDYLRSGLLVQLSAKVEGGEIKEPIHKLTIISKAHGTRMRPPRRASRLAKAADRTRQLLDRTRRRSSANSATPREASGVSTLARKTIGSNWRTTSRSRLFCPTAT